MAEEIKPAAEVTTQAVSEVPAAAVEQSTSPAVEAKTEVTKEVEAKAPEAQKVVPEKYDLKLSDGSQLSSDRLEKIAAFSKEQGFSQEQAQTLVAEEEAVVKEHFEGLLASHAKQREQWVETAKKDPEFGGANFQANAELGHRVLKKFGSDKLLQDLEASGFGDNPEVIRFFVRIGKAMDNDKLIIPGANPPGEKRLADLLYSSEKP